jgi:hypothetical protein
MEGAQSQVPWNKLEKMFKLQKIYEYADEQTKERGLNPVMNASLKSMLKERLNRKQFQKSKDVGYDKDNNRITSIPCLCFHDDTFSFKSVDNKSPLSNLAPKNKTIRTRPIS